MFIYGYVTVCYLSFANTIIENNISASCLFPPSPFVLPWSSSHHHDPFCRAKPAKILRIHSSLVTVVAVFLSLFHLSRTRVTVSGLEQGCYCCLISRRITLPHLSQHTPAFLKARLFCDQAIPPAPCHPLSFSADELPRHSSNGALTPYSLRLGTLCYWIPPHF